MQQQLVNMVIEYVYRRITIEYDDPELGKLAVAIVNTLLSKEEAMSDEKIASTLGVNATEVRRVLHLLNGVGLVVKGKETMEYGGMQEIRWSINSESMKRFMRWIIRETRSKLEYAAQAMRNSSYYICPLCFRRYPDNEASQHDFTCLVDGSPLEMVNVDVEISTLLNAISRLNRVEGMVNA